jgi:hypothetical protein
MAKKHMKKCSPSLAIKVDHLNGTIQRSIVNIFLDIHKHMMLVIRTVTATTLTPPQKNGERRE